MLLSIGRKASRGDTPAVHVGTFPDLAHGEVSYGRGEVRSVNELLNALPANSKQLADLGGPDEVVHVKDHRHKTTSHLTREPAREDTSHMTSVAIASWHPRCIESRRLDLNCHHAAFHGIGCDQYAEIVAWAGPRCQICGIHELDTPRGEIVLDHLAEGEDPPPHKIRGMICDKCNALMAKVDGNKPWGSNRTHEEAARRYLANAWYLTHPIQSPHRRPDEINNDVTHGFKGGASNARIHRLRRPWRNDIENRAACGYKVWLPAHPDIVQFYMLCMACQKL